MQGVHPFSPEGASAEYECSDVNWEPLVKGLLCVLAVVVVAVLVATLRPKVRRAVAK
jgi:hypothetical protein